MELDRDEIARLTAAYGGSECITHARRLLRLIAIIAEDRPYDADAVWLAAHLHDWGAYRPWAQEGVDHALRSRQVAEAFLGERRCPEALLVRVLECIEFHHRGGPGRSIESILITDADILDFLGVVGIARAFSRRPHDLRTPYTVSRERRATLPGLLVLDRAQEMAAVRVAEMDAFFARFEADSFGEF